MTLRSENDKVFSGGKDRFIPGEVTQAEDATEIALLSKFSSSWAVKRRKRIPDVVDSGGSGKNRDPRAHPFGREGSAACLSRAGDIADRADTKAGIPTERLQVPRRKELPGAKSPPHTQCRHLALRVLSEEPSQLQGSLAVQPCNPVSSSARPCPPPLQMWLLKTLRKPCTQPS
ncbi:hypothetical protein H920_04481 [Fukomys damarensis]|uniref:Uncharacterized protein n=1 Tax=Fukomys damarensis TaxID=885580 RepID=A0A091DV54_FUKDA|nr:hypothetical protein H920_04481 [Fukomys damarensis]